MVNIINKDSKLAVIAIDLHRGHLDPEVATMPLPAEQSDVVIEANKRFFGECRNLNIPIIHVLTLYRNKEEILSNPAWRFKSEDPNATRNNVANHNLIGMPGTEIIPELLKEGDHVVDTKKRYNCFRSTDLEFLLHSLEVDTILLTGVNTNSCVLATTVDGSVKDFNAIVIEDCVDTMDGEELHEAALKVISTAFGWVRSSSEVIELVKSLQKGSGKNEYRHA
ncbi:cysteine hydrolase family protein [Aquibacillus sediminis]|uniref:cysteine hydrolase family protein n=1 Tax=Aquibacillus sediminis TaxID=2574734 RepID=UPI001AEDB252|nr:isochorismatase family cysteine hydrolase [Aquibacillus sediminis]